ncbi:head GIN domain-containing protein [Massilia agilis]
MTENRVNKFFKFGLVLATLCTFAGAVFAAPPDVASENRPIDARVVRVKTDGLVDLHIRQGSPASLTVRGDPRWLERTSTVQNGDTLSIDTEVRSNKLSERFISREMAGLRVELTLPQLREVWSESLGTTIVSGFSGDELDLTLDGAGSMNVNCNVKRLTANLGGLGSMMISGLNADGVELNLRGAGGITLLGRSKWLKADLGGLGGLNAQQFTADNVTIDVSGLGNASITARQNANLSLSGMGSVTVYGKPLNHKVSIDGLGKVSWK